MFNFCKKNKLSKTDPRRGSTKIVMQHSLKVRAITIRNADFSLRDKAIKKATTMVASKKFQE